MISNHDHLRMITRLWNWTVLAIGFSVMVVSGFVHIFPEAAPVFMTLGSIITLASMAVITGFWGWMIDTWLNAWDTLRGR